MNTGTAAVRSFNAVKGFGFIRPDDGLKDVFVHITAVKSSGLGDVDEGWRLSYDLDRGSDGKPFAFKSENRLTPYCRGSRPAGLSSDFSA